MMRLTAIVADYLYGSRAVYLMGMGKFYVFFTCGGNKILTNQYCFIDFAAISWTERAVGSPGCHKVH